MKTTTPIPLPTLNANGGLSSAERECKWWPDPADDEKRMQHLDRDIEKAGANETYKLRAISGVNEKWVNAARYFLKDFIHPTNLSNAGSRPAPNNEGLISAALTRIRDDNVVHQSIPGIDKKTLASLNLGHRDVLAAVALLGRLDRSVGNEWFLFKPEALNASDSKEA